ncbi:hypothetical protein ACG7TL_006733 [Trametes sanguinea]
MRTPASLLALARRTSRHYPLAETEVPKVAQQSAIAHTAKQPADVLPVFRNFVSMELIKMPLFERHTPRLGSASFTSFSFNWDLALLSSLRTLRACPQLEELVLRNMSNVDPESCASLVSESSEQQQDDYVLARVSDTRTIHLPRLRRASFYYSGNLRTRTVFSLLSFPALESIGLCYLDNVSPILECLRKQPPTVLPLRHLRIESCFP